MTQTTTQPTTRTFEGTVRSVSGNKTIHVVVARQQKDAKYDKSRAVRKVYAVHDEKGSAKPGDVVSFVECRPISKTKRWRLVTITKAV